MLIASGMSKTGKYTATKAALPITGNHMAPIAWIQNSSLNQLTKKITSSFISGAKKSIYVRETNAIFEVGFNVLTSLT